MEIFQLRAGEDFIRLGQVLKATGMAESGHIGRNESLVWLGPGFWKSIIGGEPVFPELLEFGYVAVQHLFPAATGGGEALFLRDATDAGAGEAGHGRFKVRGKFRVHFHQDAARAFTEQRCV